MLPSGHPAWEALRTVRSHRHIGGGRAIDANSGYGRGTYDTVTLGGATQAHAATKISHATATSIFRVPRLRHHLVVVRRLLGPRNNPTSA
ncbi:hypothetical protein ACGFZZ_20270 [Streptomyces tendae]|uniref:hypothetical protein n=1 Tax=Streptomyces tendae TaxID=1932 RepID=UPI0033EAA559